MGLISKIQARIELYRLEKRYARQRTKRSTFISDAEYVNGEYVYKNNDGSKSSSPPAIPLEQSKRSLPQSTQSSMVQQRADIVHVPKAKGLSLDVPKSEKVVRRVPSTRIPVSEYINPHRLSQTPSSRQKSNGSTSSPTQAPQMTANLPANIQSAREFGRHKSADTSNNPFLVAPKTDRRLQRNSLPPSAFPDPSPIVASDMVQPSKRATVYIDTRNIEMNPVTAVATPSLVSSSSSVSSRSPASPYEKVASACAERYQMDTSRTAITPISASAESKPVRVGIQTHSDTVRRRRSQFLDLPAQEPLKQTTNPFLKRASYSHPAAMAPRPPPLIYWEDLNPFYDQRYRQIESLR